MITTVTARDVDLPVTLAQAKEHLRVGHDELDSDIQGKLEAAVAYCESRSGRALRVSHTLTQKYDSWPCSPVQFDRQPASAITSVTYYDADGASQTVSSSNYRLLASSEAAAQLEFDDDFTRPTLDSRKDAVTITYTAGYVTIAAVPSIAKEAVKIKLGLLFGDLDPRVIEANERCLADLLGQLDWGCYR